MVGKQQYVRVNSGKKIVEGVVGNGNGGIKVTDLLE